MKKAVSIFLVLAMAVGCFVGCGSKEAKKDADKFYIGGIGPTTGDAAIYGTAVMNGAQIAVDEINEGYAGTYGNRYNNTMCCSSR